MWGFLASESFWTTVLAVYLALAVMIVADILLDRGALTMRIEWTAAELVTLKEMADSGQSSAQIAAQLGRSRNSVIAKLDRGKGRWGRLGSNQPKKATVKNKRAPKPVKARIVKTVKPIALPPMVATPLPVFTAPTTPPIGFLEAAEQNRCLHYVGDPYRPAGPDMPVCGAERKELSRYCAYHHAEAYQA